MGTNVTSDWLQDVEPTMVLRNTKTGKCRVFRNVSLNDLFVLAYAITSGEWTDDLELSAKSEDVNDGQL